MLLLRKLKHDRFMQSKVYKYLLYAAGEIVLIIIGILIALQINNWNSNRRDDAALQTHLESIARNIREDLAEVRVLRRLRGTALIDSFRIQEYVLEQSRFSAEEIALYNKAITQATAQEFFTANTSGYESLKNSTVFGRLQGNDIEQLLASYYDTVERIANLEAGYNDYAQSFAIPFILDYPQEAEFYAFTNADVIPPARFEELQPVYHRRINSALSRTLLLSTNNLTPLLRGYRRLENLGVTFVRLVERGSMQFDANDAAVMADGYGPDQGLGEPTIVLDGKPLLGAYWIGRESPDRDSAFDLNSIRQTDEGLRLTYHGGAPWATFWFAPVVLQESRTKLDYSAYDRLVLELKGDVGGESMAVIIKDVDDPDDRPAPSVNVTLSDEWQIYEIDLTEFVSPDPSVLTVPLGFVFDSKAVSFAIRTARYVDTSRQSL